MDHWEGGLRATGGALHVDKSFWYLIDFVWENNQWTYSSKEQQPGKLDIRGVSGQQEHLLRLEPSEAKETPGVFLAMDGNNRTQVKQLHKKGTEFAAQICTSTLNPMEAINLTQSEWDYIMKPILSATLLKSGIVRTFPRTLVYASKSFSGLGILHPYLHQQIKHIHTCMEQTIQESITNNLLRSNTEQLRLELGFNPDDSWHTDDTKSYLTPSWLRDLFTFCDSNDLYLQDDCPSLTLWTTNDQFIVRTLSQHYAGNDLRMINHCREFLQVITLSDISTADGLRIDPNMLTETFHLRP